MKIAEKSYIILVLLFVMIGFSACINNDEIKNENVTETNFESMKPSESGVTFENDIGNSPEPSQSIINDSSIIFTAKSEIDYLNGKYEFILKTDESGNEIVLKPDDENYQLIQIPDSQNYLVCLSNNIYILNPVMKILELFIDETYKDITANDFLTTSSTGNIHYWAKDPIFNPSGEMMFYTSNRLNSELWSVFVKNMKTGEERIIANVPSFDLNTIEWIYNRYIRIKCDDETVKIDYMVPDENIVIDNGYLRELTNYSEYGDIVESFLQSSGILDFNMAIKNKIVTIDEHGNYKTDIVTNSFVAELDNEFLNYKCEFDYFYDNNGKRIVLTHDGESYRLIPVPESNNYLVYFQNNLMLLDPVKETLELFLSEESNGVNQYEFYKTFSEAFKPKWVIDPQLSPNGKKLIFSSNRYGYDSSIGIFIKDLETGVETSVNDTSATALNVLEWRDNRYLYIRVNDEIVEINLEDSCAKTVYTSTTENNLNITIKYPYVFDYSRWSDSIVTNILDGSSYIFNDKEYESLGNIVNTVNTSYILLTYHKNNLTNPNYTEVVVLYLDKKEYKVIKVPEQYNLSARAHSERELMLYLTDSKDSNSIKTNQKVYLLNFIEIQATKF